MNVLDLFQPALRSNGLRLVVDERQLVSLTRIWKSQGSPAYRDPHQWRRKEGKAFIDSLAESMGRSPSEVIRTKRGGIGGGGETLGHWQTALAYACSLSTEMHRKVNGVVMGRLFASV